MPFNYQFVDMSTFKDDTSFQNPNDPGKIYPMYFRGDSQNRIYSLDTRTNLGNPDLNFKHAKILTEIVEGNYFETARLKKITFDEMMTKYLNEYSKLHKPSLLLGKTFPCLPISIERSPVLP